MKYYNDEINLNDRYTSSEKDIIKNILMSLDASDLSDTLKTRYMAQLKSILLSIDILNDRYIDSNVIRPGYARRLQVLLDTIKYQPNVTLSSADKDDIKVVDDEIASSDKYTSSERNMIKGILVSLKTYNISDDLKIQYVSQLKNILSSIDKLNDEEMNDSVIRSGYTRRLRVLFDEIVHKHKLSNVDSHEIIQKEILEFNNNCDDLVHDLEKLKNKFDNTNDDVDILKLKTDIVRIDNKFIKFFDNTGKKVNDLIDRIIKFKNSHADVQIFINTDSINEKIEFLKKIIKDIKLKYIEKYNNIVTSVNKKNEELRKLTNIDGVDNLKDLPIYVVPKSFAFNNKLKSIKNAKLVDMINKIKNINKFIDTPVKTNSNNSKLIQLEKIIDELNNEIKNKEYIIDKQERKKIDAIIEKCEQELEEIEKGIDCNRIQDKLTDTSIMYRSKCPLLVKRWKSAKEVYKKNNKLFLIAQGIASLSLIDLVVGPVIIPSVLCGNMILAHKQPKFTGATDGLNKVLARVIDAKKYKDGYKLHTGVELNETTASVSILKTIAICEGKEWVVPLVYSAKNLFEKMKLVQLKRNITGRINNTYTNNIKVKNTLIEISRLFKKFQESRLSMDDFCERNNVSTDDRIMLETFNKKVMG